MILLLVIERKKGLKNLVLGPGIQKNILFIESHTT